MKIEMTFQEFTSLSVAATPSKVIAEMTLEELEKAIPLAKQEIQNRKVALGCMLARAKYLRSLYDQNVGSESKKDVSSSSSRRAQRASSTDRTHPPRKVGNPRRTRKKAAD